MRKHRFRFGDVVRISDAYAKDIPTAYIGTYMMVVTKEVGAILKLDPRDHRKGFRQMETLPDHPQKVDDDGR